MKCNRQEITDIFHLRRALTEIQETERIAFLKVLGSESVCAFLFEDTKIYYRYELHALLDMLPKADWPILFNFLGEDVLNKISEKIVMYLTPFQTVFCNAIIISVLANEELKNGMKLTSLPDLLYDSDNRRMISNLFESNNLKTFINNETQLKILISAFRAEGMETLITFLGSKRLKSIIRDGIQLSNILYRVRESDMSIKKMIINYLGNDLNEIIKDEYQLERVLQTLPEPEFDTEREIVMKAHVRRQLANNIM